MKEKFKIQKIAKRNTERTILAINNFSEEDNRIKIFKKFLGISDTKIRTEILDNFLILLKNLPISFFKLFEDLNESDNITINIDKCFEIYLQKFKLFNLEIINFDDIFRKCIIYKNDKILNENNFNLNFNYFKDVYFLNRYYNKSIDYFHDLILEFKSKKINSIELLKISQSFSFSNSDFEPNLEKVLEVFKRNFKVENNEIYLGELFEFYQDKFNFKIKILDFISITLDCFITIYDKIEKKLIEMWGKIRMKDKDIMLYKDFEQFLNMIFGENIENKWKFNEYFK
jgi:hypothetical protein